MYSKCELRVGKDGMSAAHPQKQNTFHTENLIKFFRTLKTEFFSIFEKVNFVSEHFITEKYF